MGITTLNFFVRNKPWSTLDDLIARIEHAARLVGVDHVDVGSDSSIGGWRQSFPAANAFGDFAGQFRVKPGADVRWPPFTEELNLPEKIHLIRRRLFQRGFTNAEVARIRTATSSTATERPSGAPWPGRHRSAALLRRRVGRQPRCAGGFPERHPPCVRFKAVPDPDHVAGEGTVGAGAAATIRTPEPAPRFGPGSPPSGDRCCRKRGEEVRFPRDGEAHGRA